MQSSKINRRQYLPNYSQTFDMRAHYGANPKQQLHGYINCNKQELHSYINFTAIFIERTLIWGRAERHYNAM